MERRLQRQLPVREVWVWGFGAPQSPGTYPTIFIHGYVNGVRGVWQSIDNCATWQMIGDAQCGGMTFDNPNCMSGDMNVPGKCYVGFLGLLHSRKLPQENTICATQADLLPSRFG